MYYTQQLPICTEFEHTSMKVTLLQKTESLGKGISILNAAGIEVVTGILEKEAEYLNRAFIFRIKTGKPWGVLKWAMSFDGRLGVSNGSSNW